MSEIDIGLIHSVTLSVASVAHLLQSEDDPMGLKMRSRDEQMDEMERLRRDDEDMRDILWAVEGVSRHGSRCGYV